MWSYFGCLLHLYHDRVLGCTVGEGRPMVRSQDIDGAATVDAVFIRFIPRALRDIHHTGQDSRRDATRQDKSAASVIDFDLIAISDISRRRIDRIHEHALRECLLQPVIVIVSRVHTMKGVMPDGL